METMPYAFITGASSGIGFELAKEFARNGFDLLIVSEKQDGLQEAAETLRKMNDTRVELFATDLSARDGVERLYKKIKSDGRPIDAAAINAGVGASGAFADESSLEAELQLIDLNVVSTVHLAKRISADMVKRGSGRILFTASIAALAPSPFEAVYGASKAFVLSFAESLRNELADHGITVTALLPGPTETNFFHRAEMDDTKIGMSEKDSAEQVAKQGFKALMDGDAKIIAGSLSTKTLGMLAEIAPSGVSAAQHRKMSEKQE